jgi:hypothetical protein
MFVIHQVIVWWVVTLSAPLMGTWTMNILRSLGLRDFAEGHQRYLNGPPCFWAYIATGVVLGFLLARSLRDASMVWVWTIPCALMVYAVVAVPTLIPQFVSPEYRAGVGQSRFFHYFGWGCDLGNYCLDQTSITRPFYVSLVYSFASLIALKLTASSDESHGHKWATIVIGALFVLAGIWDCILAVRLSGWNWMFLIFDGVPAAMGLFLILLALLDYSQNSSVTA